jgi:hypothetical protein
MRGAKKAKKDKPKNAGNKDCFGGGGVCLVSPQVQHLPKFGVTPEHKGNLEWENKDLQVVS